MAFETGTALGPIDLLGKIKVFAETAGWTTLYYDSTTANQQKWGMKKSIQGEERFFYWLARDDSNKDLLIKGLTGWDAGQESTADNQPGAALMWAYTNYLTTPLRKYWIFGDTDYIHVVVETVTGYFAHFGVGVLEKCQTYTGGEYVYGTYFDPADPSDPWDHRHGYPFDSVSDHWSDTPWRHSHVRAIGDGAPNGWYYFTSDDSQTIDYRYARGQTRHDALVTYLTSRSGPLHYSGRGMFIPNYIFANIRSVTTYFKYLGMTQDLRVCRTDGFEAGQSVNLGSDVWWVFPIRHDGGSGLDSGNYAMAFKQVP